MSVVVRLREWRPEDRGACLVAYGLLLLWCAPLLLWPFAFGDGWDLAHSYFYAIRTSLLSYGQFPGFDAWMGMGSPLWARPDIGPISLLTPWIWLCGPVLGLKLGLVACYFLAFEAGRALGREIFAHPLAAVIAGLLYALNGAFVAHLAAGQMGFAAYPLLPWVALWCLRLKSHRLAGLWAGLLAGLMLHSGLVPFVIHGLLLCAVLALAHGLRLQAWKGLIRFACMGLLSFSALALPKLMPVFHLLKDLPQGRQPSFGLSPSTLVQMFFVPTFRLHAPWLTLPMGDQTLVLSGDALFGYVGFSVLLLALLSLRKGLRFFHVGAVLCFLLLLGQDQPWMPSFWLLKVTELKAFVMSMSWRVLLLACLAFAAAQSIDQLLAAPASDPPAPEDEATSEATDASDTDEADGSGASDERVGVWRRRWPLLAVWLLPLELMSLMAPGWWSAVTTQQYPALSRKALKIPASNHIVAVKEFRPKKGATPLYYPLFVNRLGAAHGNNPALGRKPVIGAHVYVGHPGYIGEYVISGGDAVKPVLWSPNHLLFKGLAKGQTLWLNLTPGRGWKLHGEPLFAKKKGFLVQDYFLVKVPPSGVVSLRYEVPGLMDGVWLSLMCLLILLYWWVRARRAAQPPDNAKAPKDEPQAEEQVSNV